MSIQASEAFGLFLTALRNAGVEIPLNDKAAALLISDALQTIDPATEISAAVADALCNEFYNMADADLLCSTNGTDDSEP